MDQDEFTVCISSRLIIGACLLWIVAMAAFVVLFLALIWSQPAPQGVV